MNAQSLLIRTHNPNAIHQGVLRISVETGARILMSHYGRLLWLGRYRIAVRVDHDDLAVVAKAIDRVHSLIALLNR